MSDIDAIIEVAAGLSVIALVGIDAGGCAIVIAGATMGADALTGALTVGAGAEIGVAIGVDIGIGVGV